MTDTRVVAQQGAPPPALAAPELASALEAMLPSPAARERFMRVCAQAFTREPKLLQCTPGSVVNSIVDALTWGLEPSGRVGGAYLVPYRENVGTRERPSYEYHAQMIPDYRGLIDIITRPPSRVRAITVHDVRETDEFSYSEGTNADVQHRPSLAPDRSTRVMTHAYAIAILDGGEKIARVIDRSYAERIRQKARATHGPWSTDFDAMFRKTAVKALGNTLPVSTDVRALLERDDALERAEAPADVRVSAPDPARPKAMGRLGRRLQDDRRIAAGAPVAQSAEPEPPDASEQSEASVRSAAAPAAARDVAAEPDSDTQEAVAVCGDPSPWTEGQYCALAPDHPSNHQARNRESWNRKR